MINWRVDNRLLAGSFETHPDADRVVVVVVLWDHVASVCGGNDRVVTVHYAVNDDKLARQVASIDVGPSDRDTLIAQAVVKLLLSRIDEAGNGLDVNHAEPL